MTTNQWLVMSIATAITALPWVLFIIVKMRMKPDEDE